MASARDALVIFSVRKHHGGAVILGVAVILGGAVPLGVVITLGGTVLRSSWCVCFVFFLLLFFLAAFMDPSRRKEGHYILPQVLLEMAEEQKWAIPLPPGVFG